MKNMTFLPNLELSIISMIFYNNFTAPSFIKGLVNPTLIRRKPKTASPKNGLAVFLCMGMGGCGG
jgi:hypothetical protein